MISAHFSPFASMVYFFPFLLSYILFLLYWAPLTFNVTTVCQCFYYYFRCYNCHCPGFDTIDSCCVNATQCRSKICTLLNYLLYFCFFCILPWCISYYSYLLTKGSNKSQECHFIFTNFG